MDLSYYTITTLKLLCHKLNISALGRRHDILERLSHIDNARIEECMNDIELEQQMSNVYL